MDVLIDRCAGLDIGKKTLTVCLRTPDGRGGRASTIRTYTTMTRSLGMLRDWLVAERVTVVGMESTSTYWKPVFYALENDLRCWLLNAAHLKAVPGRKSDLLTELSGRSSRRCVRGAAGLARFAPRDQRWRRAAGVVRAGGAAAGVA